MKLKHRKKKSSLIINIFIVFTLFIGVGLLLYPTVSNWVNERTQSKAVASYITKVLSVDESDRETILAEAEEYNSKLAKDPNRYLETDERQAVYQSMLDVDESGVMGRVEIPKLGVDLPIYHGTSDAVLQIGAGHLYGTSLPVGGQGTHAAISAHRGLTSATLFTHLDEMEVGDKFYITVLDQTMAYQVDRIDIVSPEDMDLLKVDEDEDYVTLVTCTPYSVNSHRLLVRGTRVEYVPEEKVVETPVVTQDEKTDWFLILIAGIVLVFVVWALLPVRKKKSGR